MPLLSGLKVIDFSRLFPGPFCTMLLADMGADVIKVENPVIGDPARLTPPFSKGQSVLFTTLNRNKRSLAASTRTQDGRDIISALAKRADVIVEGYKPGYPDRIGIGYEVVQLWNPSIVYCSLSGYGQQGARSDRSGHDINFMAVSGLLALLQGHAAEPSVPSIQISDLAVALHATVAILAAVIQAKESGRGAYLDVSLLDSSISLLRSSLVESLVVGHTDGGRHTISRRISSYRLYRTKDGLYMSLGILEPTFGRSSALRSIGQT